MLVCYCWQLLPALWAALLAATSAATSAGTGQLPAFGTAAAAAAPRAADAGLPLLLPNKRHVRWYMASGAQQFKTFNEAWLEDPRKRAAITGVYACCNYFVMNASGWLNIDSGGRYSARFAPFLSRGLTVHATGMLDEAAVKSGAALRAIPQLVEFVTANGLDGIMSDYEPVDESKQHAQAYARFLAAAAAALHRIPGRRREIGLNIADWTILGPGYWGMYRDAGVDFMGSMTPTYAENALDWPYVYPANQPGNFSPHEHSSEGYVSVNYPYFHSAQVCTDEITFWPEQVCV
eukprot:COSAG05_NODE_1422_length_4926_cov_14.914647_1_plen_292_part_00